MFLAKGSFWQVGLVSEEGAWMDNAEASNSAAPLSSCTEETGMENSCPHPAPLGCGYHFHKNK